ncbi:UNKNOWN [Stylonychia lemnae]|uniref:Uncharacterized protein n=1 Tax=Stylonychia lemnae TaxID=5949 RepID=A0A078AZM0_STYLE|nr:UNKNOWN [Stylonychia lemnae]|eukprot:CDW86253.1 UNKNOWN [Stylonychia lemnae]
MLGNAVKSKAEIIQNLYSLQTQNNQKLDEILVQNSKQPANEGLDEKITMLNQKLDQVQENSKYELDKQSKGVEALDVQVKGLDEQVKDLGTQVIKIQDDLEFIKSSLIQLLQKQNQ